LLSVACNFNLEIISDCPKLKYVSAYQTNLKDYIKDHLKENLKEGFTED
jgi:hypothetical protein